MPFINHVTLVIGGRTEETNRCCSLHWVQFKDSTGSGFKFNYFCFYALLIVAM